MNELVLIAELKSLEASWGSLDRWLNFWILLVVIGVVVEVVVIWIEYSHELHEFRRGIVKPPDKPSSWLLVFGLLGAGFVAFGVAGEFAIHIRAGKVESDMRNVTFKLVAIANKKAEEAGKDAARLQREAETERLARVKIEARVAWRHLTEQQKAEISSRLGDFSSREGASFWYQTGDTEAAMFATDLAECLKEAHIVVQPPADMTVFHGSGRFGDPIRRIDTGVIIQSTKDERSRSLADAIVKELNLRGFDAARQKDPPFDDRPIPQVWINVWPRPEGPQGEFKLKAKLESEVKKK